MILALLIGVLVAGAIACSFAGARARSVALTAVLIDLALVLLFIARGGRTAHLDVGWIPPLGVRLHLFADGLSLTLLLLTLVLALLALSAPSSEIERRPALYHFNLMLVLAGIAGVFTAADLFLFYFFWELMLVPMYFLIAIWGHEDRARAATKFFVFTQAGSLLLLFALLALVVIHRSTTGVLTFDAPLLFATPLSPRTEMLLFLGFFLGFAVKLPAVPIHTWLPDAHTEAPTGGSVLLAGLLLKSGGYGLLRFAIPLFPRASADFAPLGMTLGVAGILYGAFLSFGQRKLKRMIAYTSVSHLGFVLLGAFTLTEVGRLGAVLQMVTHGLSTGALFLLAGAIQARFHTRDLGSLGGLASIAPLMSAAALLLALASLGLPGMGNFVAELSILAAAFAVHPAYAITAALGLILSTLYSLRLFNSIFTGPTPRTAAALSPIVDLDRREQLAFGAAIVLLVLLGLHPDPMLLLLTGRAP